MFSTAVLGCRGGVFFHAARIYLDTPSESYLRRRLRIVRIYRGYNTSGFSSRTAQPIAGAVVGMFSNFNITQNASIPPLAIAFLVGYAADVFFSFLEGLLQTFTRRAEPQTQSVSKG
jgi:hypothetical protein